MNIVRARNPKRRALVRKLIAEGKTQTEIAEQLKISTYMVHYHSSDSARLRSINQQGTNWERKAAGLDIDGILKELDEGKFD